MGNFENGMFILSAFVALWEEFSKLKVLYDQGGKGSMLQFKQDYSIKPDMAVLVSKEHIRKKADQYLKEWVPHITDEHCSRSAGGIHDFYSEGDYWWPDPQTTDGLPYIRRDGKSNPDNFSGHRLILRRMRNQVSTLAMAYKLFGEEAYACHALRILKEFFIDEETKMNPSLDYGQAIAGICRGRGIGVIDTIHLADVPFAIEAMRGARSMTEELYSGLVDWFASYLGWMLSSRNGIEEMNTENNHCVCYFMQAAVFARFTDNEQIVKFCRMQYKTRLLPQMDPDGSFPLELARTKPYNYSAFLLDNLTSICQLLSEPEDDLWTYETPDHKSYKKALDFLSPYILDKTAWPYQKDVEHFDSFPVRYSFLLFAGHVLGHQALIDLYLKLPETITDEEALRNLAVRMPLLWM